MLNDVNQPKSGPENKISPILVLKRKGKLLISFVLSNYRSIVNVVSFLIRRTNDYDPVTSQNCFNLQLHLLRYFILIVSEFRTGIHYCGQNAVFNVFVHFRPLDWIYIYNFQLLGDFVCLHPIF